MKTATVKLLSLPYSIENGYSYNCPDDAFEGAFTYAPFGAGNHATLGVITGIRESCDDDIAYKALEMIFPEQYSLSKEMLTLAEYISDTTLCSFGDAVRTVFPTAILGSVEENYTVTDAVPDAKDVKLYVVYDAVKTGAAQTKSKLIKEFGASVKDVINALCRSGYLQRSLSAKLSGNIVYDEFYTLEEYRLTKSPGMNAVINYLRSNGTTERSELIDRTGVGAPQLKTLCDKGIISRSRTEKYRRAFSLSQRVKDVVLTDEQKQASDRLIQLYRSETAQAALLYGVTGSGKTLVIKTVCDAVIADGKQVIMLLPEIALTPQSLRIFSSYYGERIAILHSSLSEGEKYDAWRRIKNGKADIVIGTRSAAFAPVPKLGLFVIDEEQETSYKSDRTPKYRAKDVARFRCAHNNALMLLSSATPSIESFYKAKTGKYSLIKLASRYGNAGLPEVKTADLRVDYANGITDPIGTELCRRLNEVYGKGEQSILFLNRRGYSNYVSCKLCGEVIMCPHCDVSLTYHKQKNSEKGKLMCHYCGYTVKEPEQCPSCGSSHIGRIGYGTQKIEEQLSVAVPGARVLRMDADTTAAKNSYDKIISDFRQHKADILIGTQMVTKGHDFPLVTLVGVINADGALYLDDYHAHERSFSLLTQVIGRAGRGEKPGVALIQTFDPEHAVIEQAKAQDYDSFYESEIKMREALLFPPFCDILLFAMQSEDEQLLRRASAELRTDLQMKLDNVYKDVQMLIYGPCEMQIFRLNGVYRMQLLCKLRSGKRQRALVSEVVKRFMKKYPKNITISVDINPNQM